MFDIKKVKKVREAKVRESKHFELSRIKEKGFEKGCLIFAFFDVLLKNMIYV